ncbi:MAG: hypothetical protein KF803_00310 [Cyclobacteriaceae bacterium]|nr:hypothetical protein [Cyclobacteriaceae bacterium]
MRSKVLFCYWVLSILSIGYIYAQSNQVYDYTDDQVVVKPKPSQEFIEWLKTNNSKFGKPAKLNTPETTKVTLIFSIDEDGKVGSPQVWRGIGQGYDEEAYYLIKDNPYSWSAGELKNGTKVPVTVYYQLDHVTNDNKIVNVNNKVIE